MTTSTPTPPEIADAPVVDTAADAATQDAAAQAAEAAEAPAHDAAADDARTVPTAAVGRLARAARVGEVTLDPRRNALNLVRLVLALGVLVSHGWALTGHPEPAPGGEKIGTWAVFGFFALSGYLVTGSRLTSPLAAYALRRVTRIFPAFLVCLVVTAFGFAPVGYWAAHRTLDGFFSTATTPVNYILSNISLRMGAYDVAGTPSGVPYPGAWDGSLWSLYLEFGCYVLVAAVFSVVALRRRPVLTLALGFLVAVAVHARMPALAPFTQDNADLRLFVWLLPFFLAGGLVRVLERRVVLTTPGAAVSALAAALLAAVGPAYGPQLAAPFIVYLLLWAGAVLPCPAWIRRHDISYGAYIYAFPVQQLLLVLGATAWPLLAFDVAAVALTVPLAAASWFAVERPIMRRARQATRP